MLYGVMYSYQLLKKRECFKMKMFYIFLILISANISSDSLYGFENESDRGLFLMLISISGIGPKLALTILSGINPKQLKELSLIHI